MTGGFYGFGVGINSGLRLQSLKTCNITYNYQSTLMGSPITLPANEPETPQISYTITPKMFPVLIGDLPQSIDYVGFLLAGCANNNASAARTLNWIVKRNGAIIATGYQLVYVSNKGVLNFNSLSGTNTPLLDDVLEIYLWCTESASDMQLNRYALGIIPGNVKPVNNPDKLLANTSFTIISTPHANFTTTSGTNYYSRKYTSDTLYTEFNTNLGFVFDKEHSVYGLLSNRIVVSPANKLAMNTSNYYQYTVSRPTKISWQETNIIYNRQ